MRNYYLPNSWYEPDCDYEKECPACTDNDKLKDITREYLTSIIDMLYGDKELNIAQLDDTLGELCYQFDLQMPAHLPRVASKNDLSTWVELNNNYLKKLA